MEIKFAPGLKLPFGPKDESLASIKPELDAREAAIDRARQSRNPFVRPVVPTERQLRRARRRDSAAWARKSRRAAFNTRRLQSDAEQSFRGQARVYFELSADASPALRANVKAAVEDMAEKLSKRDGEPFSRALGRVEGRMAEILVAYGDITEDDAIFGRVA